MLPLMSIADHIISLEKNFPMFKGIIDQFSGHAFYQILIEKNISGITLTSVNYSMKCQMFQLLKDLYTENLLDIMNHPVLIPEMLNLEAELRAGNTIVKKRESNDKSFQDDLSDAFARAIWECWKYYNLETGTNSAGKIPSVVSFGGGRVFSNTGEAADDLTRRLARSRSATEYQKLKRGMHGAIISGRVRDPSKSLPL